MYNNREYIPTYITGTSSTAVFSGKGILHSIVVGTTTGTQFVAYDGSSASGGTVVLLKSSIAEGTYLIDATIANGLFITAGTSGTYTVLYTK